MGETVESVSSETLVLEAAETKSASDKPSLGNKRDGDFVVVVVVIFVED